MSDDVARGREVDKEPTEAAKLREIADELDTIERAVDADKVSTSYLTENEEVRVTLYFDM